MVNFSILVTWLLIGSATTDLLSLITTTIGYRYVPIYSILYPFFAFHTSQKSIGKLAVRVLTSYSNKLTSILIRCEHSQETHLPVYVIQRHSIVQVSTILNRTNQTWFEHWYVFMTAHLPIELSFKLWPEAEILDPCIKGRVFGSSTVQTYFTFVSIGF